MMILLLSLLILLSIGSVALASTGAHVAAGVLAVIGAWVALHSPLLLALMPSIVTGLSTSPRTRGLASMLKVAFNFLSVATFKDREGTFQLPFGLQAVVSRSAAGRSGSPPSPATSAPEKPTVAPPPVPTQAVMGFVLLLASCGGWNAQIGKNLGRGLLDCTVGAAAENAIKVLPAVSTVIKGGTVNWSEQLETLGVGFGVESVMCAAKQVMASLAASSTAMRASPALIAQSEAATKRGETFIKKHGYHPDNVRPPLPLPSQPADAEPAPGG